MTTKHVVADDVFGKINRKQWEINRRILEGSLNPEKVLKRLQSIVENSNMSFEIENQRHFKIADTVYELQMPDAKVTDLRKYAESTNFFYRAFHWQTESHDLKYSEKRLNRKRKARVRLAQVTTDIKLDVLKYELQRAGITLASGWELAAFISQSPIGKILTRKAKIFAYSGGQLTSEDGADQRAGVVCAFVVDEEPTRIVSNKIKGWGLKSEWVFSTVYTTYYFLVLDR